MRPTILAALFALAACPAVAQDHSAHGAAPAVDLPAICLADAGEGHAMAPMPAEGDDAHRALMAGMDRMNSDMMAGATAADIDVAFICSMIPHHRGAIDMARAVLEHGDDAFARDLAERIIAAQEAEIAEMLAWLATQPR